jgi:hypothetical protein
MWRYYYAAEYLVLTVWSTDAISLSLPTRELCEVLVMFSGWLQIIPGNNDQNQHFSELTSHKMTHLMGSTSDPQTRSKFGWRRTRRLQVVPINTHPLKIWTVSIA